MTGLIAALAGLAFLDSLSVLNIGVVAAIVYVSRLNRQSALPGGLSFIGGVYSVTSVFGLCAVLGIDFLTDLTGFELTPATRYGGGFLLGVVLILLAFFPLVAQSAAPGWAMAAMRQRPWLLGFVGVAIGLGQAPTAVPYLAGLAMIAAQQPLPAAWPALVLAYCAVALLPCMLVLALSTSKSKKADRAQRLLVRTLTQYGPLAVRILFVVAGILLIADALVHRAVWW
ncbi:GAP family protein [Mycobacterium sp. SMC-4]|uniref:GAP family protein n=1 Tax=Mycobacterium sp. SMC-4 TaxID=2857059 RepID=UPI0021B23231|nr:GAP family protein [Mycobacterium sp. SMC-4]UXA18199.1 GAP family protein [Mycobacterium sp. SMC-4]